MGNYHTVGVAQNELIYMSLPPSGGYGWYYNLYCSQAWLLRYIYRERVHAAEPEHSL